MKTELLRKIRKRYSYELDSCLSAKYESLIVYDNKKEEYRSFKQIEDFITYLAFQQSFWYGWLREDKVIGRQRRLDYCKMFKRIA